MCTTSLSVNVLAECVSDRIENSVFGNSDYKYLVAYTFGPLCSLCGHNPQEKYVEVSRCLSRASDLERNRDHRLLSQHLLL